jgi:hypothetical protein
LICNRCLVEVTNIEFGRDFSHHFLEKLRRALRKWETAPKRVGIKSVIEGGAGDGGRNGINRLDGGEVPEKI